MNRTTYLALYATFGVTLAALDFSLGSWQFWCLFGLFVTNGVVSTSMGFDTGMKTMSTYVTNNIDAIVEQVRARKP